MWKYLSFRACALRWRHTLMRFRPRRGNSTVRTSFSFLTQHSSSSFDSLFFLCCWCVFLFLISLRARTLFLCLFFPHPPHWWKVWIGRLMSSSWHPAAARTCATVYLFFFRRCARRLIQHTIHQLLPLFPRRSSCFPSKVWLILVSVGDELGKKETERNRNHKRMLVRITAALNFRLFLIFFLPSLLFALFGKRLRVLNFAARILCCFK